MKGGNTYTESDCLKLTSYVSQDEVTRRVSALFDYNFDGCVSELIHIPVFPTDFKIGLIVGSSGSGKTTILNTVYGGGNNNEIEWDNSKAIVSNFNSYDEAVDRLGAVGLNSIPTWMKPYKALSNGEKFRADLARKIQNDAVIDEFTSVVNREVAKSCCISIHKYINNNDFHNIVFASCHDDIIPYLQPDWIYNTDSCQFYNGRYLCRPEIVINIYRCGYNAWELFKKYHYLSGDINKASRCYIGIYNNRPVAFCAVLSFPSGTLKHAYREHRVVVLPDYQGMGIGNKFSEIIADMYHKSGCRYFCKTANPRMGNHRDNSPLWRPTSKNHKSRQDYKIGQFTEGYKHMNKNIMLHMNRVCYSHEYIGDGIEYPYKALSF